MTPEQRRVLTIAVLATFVAFLDGTVVNVALPAIVDELGGGITTQQWVVDGYLVTLGALILVAGSVSDVYGRLRVVRWGLIGFGVTSVAVALAPTAPLLIAARFGQGAAGALLVPSSLALIMANFRGAAQAKAIDTWTGLSSAAMILGPIVGGLCVDLGTWRLAFLTNVAPIAWVLYLLTRLEQRDVRAADATVDIPDAVLCVVGLAGTVYALIEQTHLGWAHPAIWASAGVGAAALAAFLRRQARSPRPMMPLALFRARNFAWGNAATALIYGALALSGFIVGVYLQEGIGLSATVAGAAMLPVTLTMVLISSRVGALAGRIGPRLFMTMGPMLMAAGTLLMLAVREDFSYATQLLPGVMLYGIGLAVTVAPLTSAILGAIEPARSGIASAVNNAVSRIAGLIAIAMVGSIVGGVLDVDGFHRGLLVCAALFVVGGAVSWIGIRRAPA